MNARTLILSASVVLLLAGGVYVLAGDGTSDAPTVEPITVTGAEPAGPAPDPADASGDPARDAGPDPATPAGSGAEGQGTAPGAMSPTPATEPGPQPPADPEATTAEPAADRSPPATAGPGASQEPTPEAVLRAASRAYEGVSTIRADFEQRLENTLLGRTTYSAGTIYQRQPDLFRMEFTDPAGDLVVGDGEYFWTWYPSVDSTQVIRTARGAVGLDLRSQFIGDPVERYETAYHGTESVRGRPAHVMTLLPRAPAGYARLKVWIDRSDHLVRRFELTETNGNVRRFELTDLDVNVGLPDQLFRFTPPPGARVVTR